MPDPDAPPKTRPAQYREHARRALAWGWVMLTSPIGATEIGWFRPTVWVAAATLTTATYLVWNLACLRGIEAAYDTATLPDWTGVESQKEAVSTVREVVGAAPKLRDDGLTEAFTPSRPPKPLHTQLETYIDSVVAGSADPEAGRRRARFLRERLTGSRTGVAFFIMRTRPFTGVQFVKELKREDRDWARRVEARPDAKEYETFVAKLADHLYARVQPEIRELDRLGGYVQWATVFLAWFIVALCGRRFRWLTTTEGRQVSAAGGVGYRESVEAKVYGPLSYLLAALPSLGFIGTVVGMGEALLQADSLFTEANKQQAIGGITRQLGFAFDTTLVALVAGLLTGLLAVALRSFETGRMADTPAHQSAVPPSPESANGYRKG